MPQFLKVGNGGIRRQAGRSCSSMQALPAGGGRCRRGEVARGTAHQQDLPSDVHCGAEAVKEEARDRLPLEEGVNQQQQVEQQEDEQR